MMRNKIKDIGPYEINSKQKKIFFQKEINLLTKHHYSNSSQYKNLLNSFKQTFSLLAKTPLLSRLISAFV